MSENDPQLPENIRKVLKKSPTFTPTESFYRGVLEKIERKRPSVPWYFGYPMKTLATACVLVMLVLVTRETRKTRPEIFEESLPAGAPVAGRKSPMKGEEMRNLADSKEVQGRLNRSISNRVDNPSPFEKVDAEAKRDLQ